MNNTSVCDTIYRGWAWVKLCICIANTHVQPLTFSSMGWVMVGISLVGYMDLYQLSMGNGATKWLCLYQLSVHHDGFDSIVDSRTESKTVYTIDTRLHTCLFKPCT